MSKVRKKNVPNPPREFSRPFTEDESQFLYEMALAGPPHAGGIDRELWQATLLVGHHDNEEPENGAGESTLLKSFVLHPRLSECIEELKEDGLQAAYEAALDEHPDGGGIESDLGYSQVCLMRHLRLAWAATRLVFGEQATPDLAWRFFERTEKELAKEAEVSAASVKGGAR